MSLSIDLSLRTEQVLLGGEVALQTVLRNEGDGSVETASLFDNNQITNYVLSDAQDKTIATLNHITRQHLFEKVEPRTEDFRLMTLNAGEQESREDNLTRYHWFDRPGSFFVRALYRWKDQTILSAPRRLEILPAPLCSFDQQWGYHYGEKFALHSCWMVQRSDGATELFLRESLRFSPQVIQHNPSLGLLPPSAAPRVSFDRTLMAGGSVWLAWLDDSKVTALRTQAGKVAGVGQRHALPLTGLDWAAPPLRSANDNLTLFVSGMDAGVGRRVMAVELRPDGSEAQRAFVTPALAGAVLIQGVCDEEGGFHLFWLTGDAHEIKHMPIDLATLAAGAPTTIWAAPSLLVGFFTPPVLTADSFFSCAFTLADKHVLRLGIAWLQLDQSANPLKVQELALPGPDTVLRTSGEMNQSGHLFAAITTPRSVHYVNGALMQMRTLASASELFPGSMAGLTINHRDDVFFVANRIPYGLSETLVHRGTDEDITQKEERDETTS